MKFSEKIKNRIDNDRNYKLIIANDKILSKYYVDTIVNQPSLFDHRLYAGYDTKEAILHLDKNTAIKSSNSWHKIRFFFDDFKNPYLESLSDSLNFCMYFESWKKDKPSTHEWGYHQTAPGFVVEKIIAPMHNCVKLFVFHGRVQYIWIQTYDISEKKLNIVNAAMYDRRYKFIDEKWLDIDNKNIGVPVNIKEMISISEKIGAEWDFIRVDFMYHDDKIYFSELTPYAAGGTNGFSEEFDKIMGEWW